MTKRIKLEIMGNLMTTTNELTPQMGIESEDSNRVPALLHDEANQLIVLGELLDLILLKLDSQNLLSSRRVNSNWNRIISKILSARLDFSLTFKYSLLTPPDTFILQNNSIATDSHKLPCKNLGSLTSLMTSSSSTFPCYSFRFNLDCGGHLTHHQISSFFLLHGSHVRTLSILLDGEGHVDQLGHTTPMSNLVDLLLNHVPLLKSLTLNVSLHKTALINQLSLTKWPLIPLGSQMTNLETLRIGGTLYRYLEPAPLLKSILRVSPNLKTTQISHLSVYRNLEALIDTTTKVHSILSNSATIKLSDNVEILETFSRLQMKFRCIHFGGYPIILKPPHLNAAKIILKKLLEGSKETLKTVSLDLFTWTIMKTLSGISMHKVNEFAFYGPYEGFTRTMWANKLPAIFPNLSHATLRIEGIPGRIQRNLGDGHVIFQSVRSLHLWSKQPDKMPGNFYKVFPNVESLSDKTCLDFYLTAPNVWKFKRLKNLELDLYVHNPEMNIFPRIDSAFTGFSEATVRRLRNDEIDDLESLRENSSILNLAELESLEIIFRSFDWPLTSSIGLYSDVMAKFALNQMPRLKKVKFCTKPPRASRGCPPLNIQSLELALKPLLKSVKNGIWEPNSHSPQHFNGPDEYF